MKRVTRQQSRPNIIVVLVDDMGYGDLSCYGGRAKTKEIDRLAEEGIRFTQFYVNSPICSPSRTALTTGQYPARWRINSFLASRQENEQRGIAQWLDPKAPTLARFLKRAGYATGHFGKWHMGGQRDVGEAPLITEYGFDASLTQFEGLGDRVLATFDTMFPKANGRMPLGVGSEKLGRGKIIWTKRYDVTKTFVDRTIAFIEEADRAGKPFYVNVWPDDVHSPHEAPPDLRGDGSKAATYDGVLVNMDRQLGALFEYIRRNPKLRDNTIILFASDNGPEPGSGTAGSFRGHKGTLYEGGIRDPLIVWAPGLIPAARRGSRNEKTVISSVDLVPSLLRLAQVKETDGAAFDGTDLGDALLGKAETVRNRPLLWVRPPDRPGPVGNRFPDLAIREGDWKLLMQSDGTRAELYDLATDSGETRNLAEKQPAIVERLKKQLQDWLKTLPSPLPKQTAT
jgi:uncharacterized sulfatase